MTDMNSSRLRHFYIWYETVLCESSLASGNFPEVTRSLLAKVFASWTAGVPGGVGGGGGPQLASGGSSGSTSGRTIIPPAQGEVKRLSYLYDQWLFHFVLDNQFCFLCLAEREAGRRIPFTFLDQLRTDFRTKFSPLFLDRRASAWDSSKLQTAFGPDLHQLLEYYNSTDADAIRRVRGEIADLQNVMVDNIEKILLRGEKINLLVDKTAELETNAVVFRRDAAELRRIMWWRNCRIVVKLTFLILLLIFLVIWYECGFKFDKC
ncbi:unnamed protein product [Amoebophrya sp. A120]|nr:unnamed protein product [Amoebophrya sp. A120]|eukprot:GSA120T00001845001.1